MPRYTYIAIDAVTGREQSGALESASAEQAASMLKARGLAPTTLAVMAAGGSGRVAVAPSRRAATSPPAAATHRPPRRIRWGTVIRRKDLAVFTRQLAMLIKAGLPLVRGLDVLARQERNAAFGAVIVELADAIRSGGTLSDGLSRHPRIFDRLYVSMVKAGEAAGVLEIVLERVAGFLEKAERVRAKVKAALTYPALVITLAVGIVAALMVVVVPRFEQIFAGMLKGQPLPLLTRGVIGASYFVGAHGVLMVVIAGAAIGGFLVFRRTRAGERALDRLWLGLPRLGELRLQLATARFARTFGTLLANGVPILQALTITRDTSGSVVVAEAIERVHDRVREGDGVAGPLEATGVFPGMVTSMVAVGEETGALPAMLERIADAYDEEVDRAVAALTSLIEPLMIVGLAGVVGTIVIALFLPIVSIIQHLQ